MPKRIGALAAVVVVLLWPTGVALGVRIGGGSPRPPKITTYTGSDSDGVVSFKLYTYPSKFVHTPPKLTINEFHFANKCATAGTTVTKGIPVTSHHAFSINRANSTITKIVTGSLHGSGYVDASGTVRVTTATCDSGSLTFTAKHS